MPCFIELVTNIDLTGIVAKQSYW